MSVTSITLDASGCPCCNPGEPCDLTPNPPCEHCATQLKSFAVEFSGVTTPDPLCDCSNDVDDFWNTTSFIQINCCQCTCGNTHYILDPDDNYLMGHVDVLYEATQVTVTVDETGTAANYSLCPCDDSTTRFRVTGLVAPYDCENQALTFLDQANHGGGPNWRTDWSGASCTISPV